MSFDPNAYNSYFDLLDNGVKTRFGNILYDPAQDVGGENRGILQSWLRDRERISPYIHPGDDPLGIYGNVTNQFMTERPHSGFSIIDDFSQGPDAAYNTHADITSAPPTPAAPPSPNATPPTGYGSAPGTQPPAAPGAAPGAVPPGGFKSFQDVVNYMMQGHDARNLITEGMRGSGRGFDYNGITYNPGAQVGHGRTDRNPNSRFGGGAAWTGMIYRYNLLKAQRDKGGNQALGITRATTDDELGRMAATWANQNYRGTTGITVR